VRRELLLDIGQAESQIASPRAAEHLREALALAEHPDEVGVAGLWLGQALYHAGALDEAFAILSEVVERTDGSDSDAMLELEAYLLSIARAAGRMEETARRAASLAARTPADSTAASAVHATLAFRDLLSGAPRQRVRERADRALAEVPAQRCNELSPLQPASPGHVPGLDRRARRRHAAVHRAA
jgi:tetratricopeptide (TPR) repeat protein